jgi:hypothetical protein
VHCREAEDFSKQIHSPSLKPKHNKKSIIIHRLLQKFAQPLYFPMQKYYHLFYPFLQQPSYYCPEVTCNATLKFLDIYASKRIQNLQVFTARPRPIFALLNLDATSNNICQATAAIDAVILIILFVAQSGTALLFLHRLQRELQLEDVFPRSADTAAPAARPIHQYACAEQIRSSDKTTFFRACGSCESPRYEWAAAGSGTAADASAASETWGAAADSESGEDD